MRRRLLAGVLLLISIADRFTAPMRRRCSSRVLSTIMTTIADLSDDALNAAAKRAAQCERTATADLLRLLIEVERRGLHLALGHSSMFMYCTRVLLLSEQAAYSRITAARRLGGFRSCWSY